MPCTIVLHALWTLRGLYAVRRQDATLMADVRGKWEERGERGDPRK